MKTWLQTTQRRQRMLRFFVTHFSRKNYNLRWLSGLSWEEDPASHTFAFWDIWSADGKGGGLGMPLDKKLQIGSKWKPNHFLWISGVSNILMVVNRSLGHSDQSLLAEFSTFAQVFKAKRELSYKTSWGLAVGLADIPWISTHFQTVSGMLVGKRITFVTANSGGENSLETCIEWVLL